MKHAPTLYDLLEVSPGASAPVIRAAYRCLAQSYHPDKHAGTAGAGARQALINDAYAVLSDPKKRRHYDHTLGLQAPPQERRGSASAKPAQPKAGAGEVAPRAFVFRPLN